MKTLAALILAFAGNLQSLDNEASLPPFDEFFDKGVLVLINSEKTCYRLDVYIADKPVQRSRGLMYVRSMPEMTGMIFVYETDGYIGMYMRNTYIPLDMLFVRADGSVSSIAYNTEPQSMENITALEPVRYVLELNAGMAEKLSIDKFSRIEWDGMPIDE